MQNYYFKVNYEWFKLIVQEDFKKYLRSEFKHFTVEIKRIFKTNQELDALFVFDEYESHNGEMVLTPAIYLKEMYKEFQETGDMQLTLTKFAKDWLNAYDNRPMIDTAVISKEHLKQNVVLTLINTKENEHYLSELVHRKFLDLSVIYCVVNIFGDRIESIRITKDTFKQYHMTEDELFQIAMKNTQRFFPYSCQLMRDFLIELILDNVPQTLSKEELQKMLEQIASMTLPMYVLTNRYSFGGASCLLNKPFLSETARQLDSDLLLLPSSVNEVIAIPYQESLDFDNLSLMIDRINRDKLTNECRLSEQVYLFQRNNEQLSIISNTSHMKWS